MRMTGVMTAVVAAGFSVIVHGADAPVKVDFEGLLRDAGAVAYSEKADYGAGIDRVCIGYDKDGNPIAGVAMRSTKTYKEAPAVLVVTVSDGKYKIAVADIPTVSTFHGKSKDLTQKALKDITGKVLPGEKEALGLTDAVTGATKYYKEIYVSYALMSSKVIAEIKANPKWDRKPLPSGDAPATPPAATNAPAAK